MSDSRLTVVGAEYVTNIILLASVACVTAYSYTVQLHGSPGRGLGEGGQGPSPALWVVARAKLFDIYFRSPDSSLFLPQTASHRSPLSTREKSNGCDIHTSRWDGWLRHPSTITETGGQKGQVPWTEVITHATLRRGIRLQCCPLCWSSASELLCPTFFSIRRVSSPQVVKVGVCCHRMST